MMKVHDAVLKMLEARNLDYAGGVFSYHKHFIYEWVEQNKTEFSDASDVDKLDTLLTITAKYLKARKHNGTKKLFYNIVTPKPKKHLTTEIQPRVKKHLEAVLKDLDSLNIHGGDTKQAMENIRGWLENINTIIPPSQEHRIANVEDMRIFLTKNGFISENINKYIKQFQKTEHEVLQERLSQINSQ